MCGIFVVIPKRKQVNLNKAKKALKILDKRGPDYSFYKIINNVFFGQTILSMSGKIKKNEENHISKNKKFFLVYNGEVYNYKQLAQNLNEYKNKNDYSDTEILVNLFEKFDVKTINRKLDGMYAFVLFNTSNKKILITRDPQGEKSLYKYEDEEEIIISSEIEPIFFYSNKKKINFDILKTYFFSRHFIQFDKTIYKNLKIIEPGETIEINLKSFNSKKIDKLSLNDLVDETIYKKNLLRNEDDLLEELDFLFTKNIIEMIPLKRDFTSIVSGGIDSTLVSYYLNKFSHPKKFICLNHVGKDYVSDKIYLFNPYFKNKIKTYQIFENDYFRNLKYSTKICSAPISSHDFVGKYILAKETKKINCKAIFGGDGSDEFFGGYETYNQRIDSVKNISAYSKITNTKLFEKNCEYNYFKNQLNKRWKTCKETYSFIKKNDEKIKLSMMLIDGTLQLSSVGLRGSDLMSMSHSVEPRSLFLRKEIIRFALNLPLKFKIQKKHNQFITKYLLKKLFVKKFSKKLLFKKQGFAGFPNEIEKFLPEYNQFKIINLDKKFSKINLKKVSNSLKWKILNTEFFLNIN